MKLFYNPLSTYSQKALLAFYEKQVDFEREIVHLFDPEANARHREMYPIGKIPVLKPSEDHMIPESSIIVEYLDGHYSSGTRLNDPLTALLFQGMKAEDQRDPTLIEQKARLVDISYRYLNQELEKHDWLHSSGFSMADCAAMPVLFYARQARPFDDYPQIKAYWERAEMRDSWQKNLQELVPALEAFRAAHD
jgi:glutathione S-transferase